MEVLLIGLGIYSTVVIVALVILAILVRIEQGWARREAEEERRKIAQGPQL